VHQLLCHIWLHASHPFHSVAATVDGIALLDRVAVALHNSSTRNDAYAQCSSVLSELAKGLRESIDKEAANGLKMPLSVAIPEEYFKFEPTNTNKVLSFSQSRC